MTRFKNTFGVKGTTTLIKAFAVEAELLGWKFDTNEASRRSRKDVGVNPPNLWFCANNNNTLNLHPNHYWCDNGGSAEYTLPQNWDEALKAASEIVEEVYPEYYECLKSELDAFTRGKIYKCINPNRINAVNNFIDDEGRENGYSGSNDKYFKLSTKEAFDAQNKPVFKEGDYIVRTWPSGKITLAQVKEGMFYSLETYNLEGGVQKGGTYGYLNGYNGIPYRHATPEEIAEVTKPKLLTQTTLTLGTSNIKITVYKDGKVEAEGHEGTIKEVKQLIDGMQRGQAISGWEITYPTIKIGCSQFKLEELKKIVVAHALLNSSEW